ncbi:MAG: cysteine hydrolase [Rhodospirillaceae bacterium]|nr:cysteine hydrolase [Rhodospirillales bacterium]
MKKGLLLVDVQNEYVSNGKLALPDIEPALHQIGQLLDHFRAIGAPVLHLQHVSLDPEAPFAADSSGWELHERVRPELGEAVIAKYFPNGFRQTWLLSALQQAQVSELVVAGAMTQICIDSTVRSALDFGFQVSVAADACAAGALEWDGQPIEASQVQRTFLAALSKVATVAPTSELIAHPKS